VTAPFDIVRLGCRSRRDLFFSDERFPLSQAELNYRDAPRRRRADELCGFLLRECSRGVRLINSGDNSHHHALAMPGVAFRRWKRARYTARARRCTGVEVITRNSEKFVKPVSLSGRVEYHSARCFLRAPWLPFADAVDRGLPRKQLPWQLRPNPRASIATAGLSRYLCGNNNELVYARDVLYILASH